MSARGYVVLSGWDGRVPLPDEGTRYVKVVIRYPEAVEEGIRRMLGGAELGVLAQAPLDVDLDEMKAGLDAELSYGAWAEVRVLDVLEEVRL